MPPYTLTIEDQFGMSKIGKVRTTNQDALLMDPERQIYLLADGMGGHRGGEVASAMAINHLYQFLINRSPNAPIPEEMSQAFRHASELIKTEATQSAHLKGMGTTAICCLVHQNTLYIGHVGDSRLYLFSAKAHTLYQLTRDHSLLVETDASEALASGRSHKSVLTRSVGFTDALITDTLSYTPHSGDKILICSDGLYSMVPFNELEQTLGHENSCKETVTELIEVTYQHGASDNVSLIMLKLSHSS